MEKRFINLVLPDKYSYGAVFSPKFKNTITIVQSGFEQRTAEWQNDLVYISISFDNRRKDEIDEIKKFFMLTRGSLLGFLFNDKSDNTISVSEGIANEDGKLKGHPRFRLFKKYRPNFYHGNDFYAKRIFKPKHGTVKIFNNGNPVNYTVNYENGTVELPVISQSEIIAITNDFSAKITTRQDHNFHVNDKLFLERINKMPQFSNLVVSVKRVIDNRNIEVDYNTINLPSFVLNTGLRSYITKYMNNNDNITFESEFYLPVRFSDNFDISYINYNSLSVPIELVEERLEEDDIERLDT